MRASFPPDLLAELQRRYPDGSVLLADLGNLWKTLDPTFKPSRYGKESLSALLAEFPHLGRLERVGAVTRWRWISATTQQLVGRDAQVGDQDTSSEVKTGLWYLHGEIWRIVTGTDPAKVVDLTTQALVPDNAREVNEQPERFLKLPVADVFFQRNLLGRFLQQRGANVSVDVHNSPFVAIRAELEGKGLWDAWKYYRSRSIVALVQGWVSTHDLPWGLFLHQRPATVVEKLPILGQELRGRLHTAIDKMTPTELAEVKLPSRFDSGIIE